MAQKVLNEIKKKTPKKQENVEKHDCQRNKFTRQIEDSSFRHKHRFSLRLTLFL